jgi:hypothetical protein
MAIGQPDGLALVRYQIITDLYRLARPGQTVDEANYQKYIKVIRIKIDQAGIRLAED